LLGKNDKVIKYDYNYYLLYLLSAPLSNDMLCDVHTKTKKAIDQLVLENLIITFNQIQTKVKADLNNKY